MHSQNPLAEDDFDVNIGGNTQTQPSVDDCELNSTQEIYGHRDSTDEDY